ncbi:DndE family protein [Saccharospirillum mangrovi]|uniref:DndE family protein n=1 Tax=Saccharospirillum mangrovi TaxID=2161747 RepID=UPI000D376642
MFPQRVHLKKKTWDKLQYLQTKTLVTPNVIARIAILISVQEKNITIKGKSENKDHHVINRDVLFGQYEVVFRAILSQYCYENNFSTNHIETILNTLIENGLYKISHVKNLSDFVLSICDWQSQ